MAPTLLSSVPPVRAVLPLALVFPPTLSPTPACTEQTVRFPSRYPVSKPHPPFPRSQPPALGPRQASWPPALGPPFLPAGLWLTTAALCSPSANQEPRTWPESDPELQGRVRGPHRGEAGPRAGTVDSAAVTHRRRCRRPGPGARPGSRSRTGTRVAAPGSSPYRLQDGQTVRLPNSLCPPGGAQTPAQPSKLVLGTLGQCPSSQSFTPAPHRPILSTLCSQVGTRPRVFKRLPPAWGSLPAEKGSDRLCQSLAGPRPLLPPRPLPQYEAVSLRGPGRVSPTSPQAAPASSARTYLRGSCCRLWALSGQDCQGADGRRAERERACDLVSVGATGLPAPTPALQLPPWLDKLRERGRWTVSGPRRCLATCLPLSAPRSGAVLGAAGRTVIPWVPATPQSPHLQVREALGDAERGRQGGQQWPRAQATLCAPHNGPLSRDGVLPVPGAGARRHHQALAPLAHSELTRGLVRRCLGERALPGPSLGVQGGGTRGSGAGADDAPAGSCPGCAREGT